MTEHGKLSKLQKQILRLALDNKIHESRRFAHSRHYGADPSKQLREFKAAGHTSAAAETGQLAQVDAASFHPQQSKLLNLGGALLGSSLAVTRIFKGAFRR